MKKRVGFYIEMISRFVAGEISAAAFKSTFLVEFKNEKVYFDEATYHLLDSLYGDVDAYTDDKELLKENPEYFLSEEKLRERVNQTLIMLWGADQPSK
jgi:hypothetical protein